MTNKNLQPTTYHPQSSHRNLSPKTYHLKPNHGFAMLFSVLISSLLVTIGLSIFNITLKEFTISTSARESQMAFYAANSGLECALYWDLKQNAFAHDNTPAEKARVALIDARCNMADVNSNITSNGNNPATTEFEFHINNQSDRGPCAKVVVEKDDASGTIITSRGYNISGNDYVCGGASGRRVERGLRATL